MTISAKLAIKLGGHDHASHGGPFQMSMRNACLPQAPHGGGHGAQGGHGAHGGRGGYGAQGGHGGYGGRGAGRAPVLRDAHRAGYGLGKSLGAGFGAGLRDGLGLGAGRGPGFGGGAGGFGPGGFGLNGGGNGNFLTGGFDPAPRGGNFLADGFDPAGLGGLGGGNGNFLPDNFDPAGLGGGNGFPGGFGGAPQAGLPEPQQPLTRNINGVDVPFAPGFKDNNDSKAYLDGLAKRPQAMKKLKDGWALKDVNGKNAGTWTKDGKDKKVNSPIALDLSGNGRIDVTGQTTARDGVRTQLGKTVSFDIDGNGTVDQVEWLQGNGDALLVDNRDGKAAGDMSGARLFGDQGGQYASGYQKLAQLDANGDGVISGGELKGLDLWFDNGDAKVQKGELRSAVVAGVDSISVRNQAVQSGNGTLDRAAATVNGKQVVSEDVWFAKA